jgi:hypothetical protein
MKALLPTSPQGGRPPLAVYLRPFISDLLKVYVEAGGSSMRVSRGDSPLRKCRFIDFAFEVLLMVPDAHRPPGAATLEALMAWWERNHSEIIAELSAEPEKK